MSKLIIVVNEDRFFLSHRKEIAMRAAKSGFDVTIVCKDTGRRAEIEQLGMKMVELPIDPTGMSLGAELKSFLFLRSFFRKQKPDIVHLVGLKCSLWGGLAGRLTRVRGMLMAYSGLGVLFIKEPLSVTARGTLAVLRFNHRKDNAIALFQNAEDKALFIKHKVVRDSQCRFIKGSGVDLSEFAYRPDPSGDVVTVIFTGRMIREKGVMDLCDAAERLRAEYQGRVRFIMCGRLSAAAGALTGEEIEARCDGDYIQWLGFRTDVKDLLTASNIIVFPSYYREGVPKSLIEAAAIGLPIITTDSVGCRDTVEEGVNGFKVPVKDSAALADRIRTLVDDRALRQRMGKESRRIAERDFSLEDVVSRHMAIYRELLDK